MTTIPISFRLASVWNCVLTEACMLYSISRTVIVLRSLCDTSTDNITLLSYNRMEVMNPGSMSTLCRNGKVPCGLCTVYFMCVAWVLYVPYVLCVHCVYCMYLMYCAYTVCTVCTLCTVRTLCVLYVPYVLCVYCIYCVYYAESWSCSD